jgi:hypothetical protein
MKERKFFGTVIMILGVMLGLYIGGYVLFVKPIIDIVGTISSGDWNGGIIAWGILKMVCASIVGVLIGYFTVFVGAIIYDG